MAGAKNTRKMANSKEVAALANVSQATVSRVFSGQMNIKDHTRQRVIEAAETLGYRPNAIARSLILKRSNLIAIVALDVVNPHYNALVNKVANQIQRMGKEPLFFVSPEEKQLDEVLFQVLHYRVDAIIVLAASIPAELAAEFEKVQVPVVVFNKYTVSKSIMSVCSDNVQAGWMAANYLYEKGYRSFAFIGSTTFHGTSKDRLRGFRDCLYEYGIEDCTVQMVPYTYESGGEALHAILQGGGRPDAIFCAGDLLALGAMDTAKHKLHISIPKDLAVIGFDNIDAASWSSYLLTTFEQQIDTMLESAFEYLGNSLTGKETEGGVTLFACKIIERQST